MSDSVRLFINAALDGVLTKDAASSPGSSGIGLRRMFGDYSHKNEILDATTFPAVTKPPVDFSKTLVGTTFDFDLTAAPLAEDVNHTVDLTGAKLVALLYYADPGNDAAGMTLGPHPDTNPYPLWGDGIIPLIYPNECVVKAFLDTEDEDFSLGMAAVAAGAKALRLTGAVGDILTCIAYFGG